MIIHSRNEKTIFKVKLNETKLHDLFLSFRMHHNVDDSESQITNITFSI